jgi:hypothetical protein
MILDIDRAFEPAIAAIGGEIHWPGRAFTPKPGIPYVRARMAGRAANTIGLGEHAPRMWQGMLYLVVHQPASDGLYPASGRAQAVEALFKRGTHLISGRAKVTIEAVSILAPEESADWNRVPVVVTWFAMET